MGIRFIIVAALTCMLSACATGYHSANNLLLGYTGGFWEHEGPGKLTKVGFSGNRFLDQRTAKSYLLYRCAELGQTKNRKYFVIYSSIHTAIDDSPVTEAQASSATGRPNPYVYVLYLDETTNNAFAVSEVLEKYNPNKKTVAAQ